MTLFSLICCLLAVSSSAFGRSAYGSYSSAPLTQVPTGSMRDFTSQKPFLSQLPVQSGYGQQQQSDLTNVQQDIPQQPTVTGYGSSIQSDRVAPQSYGSYGSQQLNIPAPRPLVSLQQQLLDQQQLLQQKIQESTILTEADTMCRGQRPETVIPLEEGRRFIVCLDDSKGFEQHCPKGLHYHQDSRRCERKLGPLENPCASQPCMYGGQCVQTDVSSYQCQCTAGYDGKNCELDARVCQQQQPCGQSPDVRCQSFRVGAALSHICILQNGLAYGLTVQQAQPSPCSGTDGVQPLTISDKGFIMCDGESMFVESCPGGTVWDDLNKACVWPDMKGLVSTQLADQKSQVTGYGQQQQQEQQRPIQSSYGSQIPRPALEQRRPIMSFEQKPIQSGYGSQISLDQKPIQSGYGSQISLDQKPIQSGYGSQMSLDQKPIQSGYGSQVSLDQRRPTMSFDQKPVESGYGSQVSLDQRRPMMSFDQRPIQSGYGSQISTQEDQKQEIPQETPRPTSGYGFQQPIQKPQIWQQPIQRQQDFRPTQQSSGY
jgi:hypothetical protein